MTLLYRFADLSALHAAYQDFLTLWKDADPDIPMLKPSHGGIREFAIAPWNFG
jgi:hypothetical protein